MKLLFLGNSLEVHGDLDESERRTAYVKRALEAEFDEPVEMMTRAIWPTPKLPGTVDRWMREFEPDIVCVDVTGFWFNYLSVPLKVERKLGPLGKPVKNAGIRASQTRWPGETAAFHWLKDLCERLIGGATYFEPEQVLEVIEDSVRTILRHEDVALAVKGPTGSNDYGATEKTRRWVEERRQRVHRALAALCDELHIEYMGQDRPWHEVDPDQDLLGDRLHHGAEGHRRFGEELAATMKNAWRRQHESIEGGWAASTQR